MTIKELLDGLQAFLTSAAIIGGGVWFIQRRQRYPKILVEHQLRHWAITPKKTLLKATVIVENKGDMMLLVARWSISVSQIRPYPPDVLEAVEQYDDPVSEGSTELSWDPLYEWEIDWENEPREVEPGEREEILCDFVIDSDVQTVSVSTHFPNAAKPNSGLGWNKTSIYELGGKQHGSAKENDQDS